MFKNMYAKISGLASGGNQPAARVASPFDHSIKAQPPKDEFLERKTYEQEHFEGHEAECDFCLSESLENLNEERLKEYIVFAEILGKPKSRRHM